MRGRHLVGRVRQGAVPARRQSIGERGVALLVVLLTTTLVAALGGSLALLVSTERKIAAHFAAGLDALYAADAALERVTVDLMATEDWEPIATGAVRSTFLDGEAGLRTGPDGAMLDLAALTHLERCGRRSPCGDDEAIRPWRLYGHAPIRDLLAAGRIGSRVYVIVWVAAADAGAIVVRSRAYGPFGARRTVEAIFEKNGPGIRARAWREL